MEGLGEGQAGTLILIASGAFVLPLLAGRLRLPAVVLEIAFGIVIGPVTHLVREAVLLSGLAVLGFFLLMFLSGFEIDFNAFERGGTRQLATGLAVFAATMFGAWLAANALGHGLFVAFVLATTSVGLVVPTLRATRRAQTPLGQAILISALLADFLTLVGVTVLAVVEEHGGGVRLLLIPGFFIVIAVALLALRRAAWWFPEKFGRLFAIDDPDEMGIRSTLALLLVFVGLAFVFGIEPILGAFLAGTVFALVFRERGHLQRSLNGFSYGFLIPIFFINVGIGFDTDAFKEPGTVSTTLALIGFAILVKVVPALILLTRRLTLREVLAAGTLLSARLSLIIAVAELGVRIGVIDRALEASIIVLAMVTTTIAPTLFRLVAPPLAKTGPGDTPG